jgi:Kdo2-lipid IVA lauroyltransferase/acyltransferase
MTSCKSWTDWLVTAIATLWYRLDRHHRRITLRNLEFAYGDSLSPAAREQLARQVFAHFVRFAWETLELFIAPLAYIKKKTVILGQEHMAQALSEGRGMVGMCAHAGNWEYTAFGYGLQYEPAVAVGRDLDHPLGGRLLRYLRQRGGNLMVGKKGGMKQILRQLRQNRIVGIVIDQNTATSEGLLVDFFGHPARSTPVAALLARRGVPVLPTLSRRLPDGRLMMLVLPPLPVVKTSDPEADVLRLLQEQQRIIEAWVRLEPSQWLWLHRRWKNQFPELYK